MAILRLRPPSSPDTLQRVILENVEYQLRWRYVQVEDRWALDISSADGTLLAAGIRVVQVFPLLVENRAGRPAEDFPPGELFVGDARTSGRLEPSLDQLRDAELEIFYVEAADLAGAG